MRQLWLLLALAFTGSIFANSQPSDNREAISRVTNARDFHAMNVIDRRGGDSGGGDGGGEGGGGGGSSSGSGSGSSGGEDGDADGTSSGGKSKSGNGGGGSNDGLSTFGVPLVTWSLLGVGLTVALLNNS
ncbi:DENN domain-containing protein 5A, partial [Schaereria dolodes]|nr:DENN domain-containing protein 5A [Schaereria dolodes]